MSRVWFAGLLPLLVAAAPSRPRAQSPPTPRRAQQHSRRGVSAHPCRSAGDVPHQGAGCPEGRIRVRRQQGVSRAEGRQRLLDRDHEVGRCRGSITTVLVIDGVQVNDPASETFYGTGKECSGIEVPEKGVDYYLPKDVPHGEVRERWYFAKTTQQWRRIFVYTPPDYDTRPRRALSGPVPAARRRRRRAGLAEPGARRLHHG